MNRELARKRPANTINSDTTERPTARLGGVDLAEVQRKANYLYRQGSILPDYTVRMIREGQWIATVSPVQAPRPSRLKRFAAVVLIAGIVLAVVALIVKLLIMAATALLPYAILAGLLIIGCSLTAGGQIIEVVQRVTIRR